MEQSDTGTHREHPAERFAAPTHLLDLPKIAAQLRSEPLPAHQGHRQISVYHHETLTVMLFAFEPGGQLPEHQAGGVVTIHLLEGGVDVTADGHHYSLTAAMMVVLAPNVRHQVVAKQPSLLLVTVALQPSVAEATA